MRSPVLLPKRAPRRLSFLTSLLYCSPQQGFLGIWALVSRHRRLGCLCFYFFLLGEERRAKIISTIDRFQRSLNVKELTYEYPVPVT